MLECKILKFVANLFLVISIIIIAICFVIFKDNGISENGWLLLTLFGCIVLWAEMKIVPTMCEKTIEIANNTKKTTTHNNRVTKPRTTIKKTTSKPKENTKKVKTTRTTTKKEEK